MGRERKKEKRVFDLKSET